MHRSARRSRARVLGLLAATTVAAGLLAACGSGSKGITINVYKYPQENFQKIVDNCNTQAGGAYKIVYNKLPRDADGQREQMVRRLAAHDPSLDVLGLDVTWTPEFAEAGWIQQWTGSNQQQAKAGVLPGPLTTATWQGKLYAATDNTNVQLMWYRGDLVPNPPTTWDEMIADAKQLKAAGKPYQIGYTGAQYEGLVVGFNTLVASAGGSILNSDGTKAVLDAKTVQALQVLKNFATAGVTSPSLTNSLEDNVRADMEEGRSAFELNWPYVYASMRDNKPALLKNFKWAPYPRVDPGTPSRVTVGGIDYAISSYTKHSKEAFAATLCLRNAANQKFAALNDGVPPTIGSIYADPDMAKAYPMKDTILAELKTASVRPQTPAYQNVSTVISAVLSPPSSIQPKSTADTLRKQIQDALESKGVLP